MAKRRRFSEKQKVKILRRHLLEDELVSDICDKYDLNPNVFYRWQKEFFERGMAAFETHTGSRERKLKKKVSALQQKIAKKRAREKQPDVSPRIISDRRPAVYRQRFQRIHSSKRSRNSGIRTSPCYPQSNGKYERWNRSLKCECIRPQTPLSLEDARRVAGRFVEHYNTRRLHSAIGLRRSTGQVGRTRRQNYRPCLRQAGRQRKEKLAVARKERRESHEQQKNLTPNPGPSTNSMAGETEAGSAGKRARPGITG